MKGFHQSILFLLISVPTVLTIIGFIKYHQEGLQPPYLAPMVLMLALLLISAIFMLAFHVLAVLARKTYDFVKSRTSRKLPEETR